MEQPKQYYAFISYKREDKKEAKRLHKGTTEVLFGTKVRR